MKGSADSGVGPAGGAAARWWKPALLVALLATGIVAARMLNLNEQVGALRQWIGELGAAGPVVFSLIYIVAVVAAVPGSVLTIAAGALFGTVVGVAVVSVSATVGASLTFLIARYLARDAVAQWLGRSERFRKLDRLTERRGAMMVAITRLVPLFPFMLLNYGYGLTRVGFRTYVFWSWLCMLPGTVLYVAGTDAVVSGLASGEVPWGIVAAVAGTVVLLVILVRLARGKLGAEDIPEEKGYL